MKKIFLSIVLSGALLGSANASFLYEEIDPICSITGTTHTSFPWEISDTSRWNIPKAYDGECKNTPTLTKEQETAIYDRVISMFEKRDFIDDSSDRWYTLTSEWEVFAQNTLFTVVQKYIQSEISKANPNMKNIAILNYAVSVIGYDYYIAALQWEYVWLTAAEAQELAEDNGVPFRLVEIDGEAQMVTMDYVVGRINASIVDGIVTSFYAE